MREIKFRAYDIKTNQMMGTLTPFDIDYVTPPFIGGCELMQFTGLKDKNGKDIYEGDIVELKTSSGASNSPLPGIYWVKYFCDGFRLAYDSFGEENYQHGLGESPNGTTTVVGNIYENPELLSPSSPKE